MDNRQFEIDSSMYEIVSVETGNETRVRVFLDGKPAEPIVYSVTREVSNDFAVCLQGDAVECLIDIAESAFRQNYSRHKAELAQKTEKEATSGERPWWHEITQEVADVAKELDGKDISHLIGKRWMIWGVSRWGEDVIPPDNLDKIIRIIAQRHGLPDPEINKAKQ